MRLRFSIFSYRFAQEILQHSNNVEAWDEIVSTVSSAPLFIFPNKSEKKARLDVVQQCLNTWFDRVLSVEMGWDYHPFATAIPGSRLAADFRKQFPNVTVQAEVQFGNMSRWYSDIFKLQSAYSQKLCDVGLSIVPMRSLAQRIDSNIVTFERVVRELPSADLSITLPILIVGIEPDDATEVVYLHNGKFPLKALTRKSGFRSKSEHNRYRIVEALRNGSDVSAIDETSPTGDMAKPIAAVLDEED